MVATGPIAGSWDPIDETSAETSRKAAASGKDSPGSVVMNSDHGGGSLGGIPNAAGCPGYVALVRRGSLLSSLGSVAFVDEVGGVVETVSALPSDLAVFSVRIVNRFRMSTGSIMAPLAWRKYLSRTRPAEASDSRVLERKVVRRDL